MEIRKVRRSREVSNKSLYGGRGRGEKGRKERKGEAVG